MCGCAVDRPDRYICSDCLNRIPFLEVNGVCRCCARHAEGLDGEFLCEECRTSHFKYDRASSAVDYNDDVRALISSFKFKARFWLKKDLVDWLEGSVRSRFKINEIDLIIPIPSTFFRRWNRGYSQTAMLAKDLAERIKRPYSAFIMRRKGFPKPQSALDVADRHTNVIDTFKVIRPDAVEGRTVLVVDDVMTTGMTLNECASELKLNGAKRVWCCSVARSMRI